MKKIAFKSALLAAILSVGLLSSCDKDDDDDTVTAPTQTEKQKLVDKDFGITEFTASIGGVPFYTFADFDACDKDDIVHFRDDNSGYNDEGATKCDPADPQREAFTYELRELSSGNKTITINYGPGDDETFTILSNTGTQLKLTATELDSTTNLTFQTDITFTKK